MPSIDEISIEIKDNINKIIDKLDKLENKGKKSAKQTKDAFEDAFDILATGAGIGALTATFNKFISAANETEKALRGVASVARTTGNDIDKAREATVKLASDGQIGLKQSADIIRQLLKLGLDADKAFEFANASKQIGTFNGLLDTTGESVSSFTKGLITGSAELLENLDPSLRKVITDLGGYAEVAQNATARQKLINEVIARGSAVTEDYNDFLNSGAAQVERFSSVSTRLFATIGNGINEAFAPLLKALNDGIEVLIGFFEAIGPLGQKIANFGSILLEIPLAPIIALFKLLLNGLEALTDVINDLTGNFDVFNREAKDNVSIIASSEKVINSLSKAENLNAQEKARLAKSTEQLGKVAEELGVALIEENGILKTQAQLLEDVKQKQLDLIEVKLADALSNQVEQQERLNEALKGNLSISDSLANGILKGNLSGQEAVKSVVSDARKEIAESEKQIDNLIQLLTQLRGGRTATATSGGGGGGGKAPKTKPFDEAQARQQQAQFLGQEFEAKRIAIGIETEKQLENQEKLFKLEEKAIRNSTDKALDKQKELLKIQLDNERKIQDIKIESENKIRMARVEGASKTLGRVAQGAGGLASFAQGDFFGGASNIVGAINPVIGGAIGAVGSIVGSLKTLFGESEQERLARINRQIELQEIQNQLTQQLLDAERKRLDLIDKETERQLKLNEILFTDQADRLTANLNVLGEAINVKLRQASQIAPTAGGQALGATSTAQDIANQIKETDIFLINNEIARNAINASLATSIAGNKIDTGSINSARSILRSIPDDISPEIRKVIQELDGLYSTYNRSAIVGEAKFGQVVNASRRASEITANTQSFSTELNEVLDLIVQRTGLERQSGGGSRNLQFQENRPISFTDIASRGLNILGQGFQQARINPANLQAPSSISTTLNAQSKSKSIQEEQLDSLRNIEREIQISNRLLLGLRDSLDNNEETNFQLTDTFLEIQQDIESRSINARR